MKQHRLAVDIGGTFTDVVLETKDKRYLSAKRPTTPEDPVVGAMSAIDAVLTNAGLSLNQIGTLVHGTTLATNTLIEKKGACVGAVLTAGFRDILEIGYERRYNQDDLSIDKPDLLVPRERCLMVNERISSAGEILESLSDSSLHDALNKFDALGVDSIAVCLLHAYANPVHENKVAQLIASLRPDWFVSVSSGVSPEIREFERLSTTVANAYVKPLMASYLNRFERQLTQAGFTGSFFMMTSAGGMTTLEAAKRYPIRLLESGPSGGAILAAEVARYNGLDQVMSFDMGGTTAKFCMIDNGKPLTSRNFEVARAERFIKGSGIPLRIPAIEMIEIGAGGGSVVSVDSLERITVGPESMGADPGPACFRRGGNRATVTDADVALGYIDLSAFAEGQLKVDESSAHSAIARAVGDPLRLPPHDAAYGVAQMVGENMANAGRVHAGERGADLTGRTMIAFGGNGPLHATRVAEKMGVSKIIVPADPGVGSAVGFLSAPISYEIVSSFYTTLDDFDFVSVNRLLDEMVRQAKTVVDLDDVDIRVVRSAFMRYTGQGHEVEVELPRRSLHSQDLEALLKAYARTYQKQFKRTVPGMQVEIMNWAVRVESKVESRTHNHSVVQENRPAPAFHKPIFFGNQLGWRDTPVYYREELKPGDVIVGPALIVEAQTSTLVTSKFEATVNGDGCLVLTIRESGVVHGAGQTVINVIDRQLMWNRLLAVVEEQAQALVRSAFSPIVRECGDISAGIFDRTGRMLAQAVTGTPGHINTMASSVVNFLKAFPLAQMKPGDIYVTNDPWLAAGHLNDFMLVQPVFLGDAVIGFTACTSHLVDVGGLCMGPEGSDIYDEGLLVPPCRLVAEGRVDELLLDIIKANSRRPIENEGDLYALIACCEVGTSRLLSTLSEYGLTNLDGLADHIIDQSRRATLTKINELPNGEFLHALTVDGYDFEITLKAKLTINDSGISIDFTGSSPCSKYGINVPLNYAAAYSVFAVRCALGSVVPNNAGSLSLFKVSAPEGCIVNAAHPAPVAMRHTIGQLLPDLVLGCLHQIIPNVIPAEGASCMYDLPMRNVPLNGKNRFAIELVHNGGTGARPNKDGLSATAYPSGVWGSQVEMTECTVPLRIRRRELRTDSGGAGQFRGGLGQTIEIESANGDDFLLFLSLDRMKNPARGRAGGCTGATGQVSLSSGKLLPGRGEETIASDDPLIFQTPGGGGYGHPFLRKPEMVRNDVIRGLVSAQSAKEQYGVILDQWNKVDHNATRNCRRARLC